MELVNRFYEGGPENYRAVSASHVWIFYQKAVGKSMYKHLDHHLKQFAA